MKKLTKKRFNEKMNKNNIILINNCLKSGWFLILACLNYIIRSKWLYRYLEKRADEYEKIN